MLMVFFFFPGDFGKHANWKRTKKQTTKKVSLEEQMKRFHVESLLKTTCLCSFQYCRDSVRRTLMYLQPAFYFNQAHKRKHKYKIDGSSII